MHTAILRLPQARSQRKTSRLLYAFTSKYDVFSLNIILIGFIATALIGQAFLVNHLNTINFRLDDLSLEYNAAIEENNKLQALIVEQQSLESLQIKAEELGMVSVGEYDFITAGVSAVAQR